MVNPDNQWSADYLWLGIQAAHWQNFDTPHIQKLAETFIHEVKDQEVEKFKKQYPKHVDKIDSHIDSWFVQYKFRGYIDE